MEEPFQGYEETSPVVLKVRASAQQRQRLVKIQILRPRPRPTVSGTVGWAQQSVLSDPPSGSDATVWELLA